jgi:acetyltransferase-like isoleucine patch superfamily enzyme
LNRIIRLLKNICTQLLFRIKYPYLFGVRSNSLNKVTFPFGLKIGRGTRLLVDNSLINQVQITICKKVWIGEDVEIHAWHKDLITIHEGASIQDRCKILGNVEIGQNSILAPNIFISSGTHYAFHKPFDLIRNQDQKILSTEDGKLNHSQKVTIEEDVWIGTNTFIKSGITVGRGAIIGANSIISKSVSPYSKVVGVNKILDSNRLDFLPPSTIEGNNEEHRPYFYSGFLHRNILESGVKGAFAISYKTMNIDIKFQASSEGFVEVNGERHNIHVGTNSIQVGTSCDSLKHFNFKLVSLVSSSILKMEKIEAVK